MKPKLQRLSTLALRQRRHGLVAQMPPLEEVLRGSLVERYLRCGKPNCRCARGRRHGPLWYLTVVPCPIAGRQSPLACFGRNCLAGSCHPAPGQPGIAFIPMLGKNDWNA